MSATQRAILLGVLAVVAAGLGLWTLGRRSVDGADLLEGHLRGRGRVAVVGDDALRSLRAEGAVLVVAPELESALAGSDERALLAAMEAADIGALLVAWLGAPSAEGAPPTSMRERLGRYASFERLACIYLTPRAAIYAPRTELELSPLLSGALAHVARAVVAGAAVPRVQSFPEPLRRIRNVEVMVLLSDGERPRLWRSARGSSIARALLTAAVVARQRWMEREAAMGGPLARVLPTLDVSVHVLDEDGTLGSRTPAFVDAVFGPEHGVAFEHRGNWRYLLPDATRERGQGSAMRAYAALFADADMPPESLERPDVRLYRSVARRVATSPAPRTVGSGAIPTAPDGSLDWLPSTL
ncbi:MAG: hypothetical protein OHK0013_37070 [Sandaracinaceae bacterium]